MPHPSAHIVNILCPVLSINPHNDWYILTAVLPDGNVLVGTALLFDEALWMLHSRYEWYSNPFVPGNSQQIIHT